MCAYLQVAVVEYGDLEALPRQAVRTRAQAEHVAPAAIRLEVEHHERLDAVLDLDLLEIGVPDALDLQSDAGHRVSVCAAHRAAGLPAEVANYAGVS